MQVADHIGTIIENIIADLMQNLIGHLLLRYTQRTQIRRQAQLFEKYILKRTDTGKRRFFRIISIIGNTEYRGRKLDKQRQMIYKYSASNAV